MTSVSLMLQTTMRVQQTITGLAIKGDQALSFMYPAREQPEWAVFDEDEAPQDPPAVKADRSTEAGGIGRFALYSTPIAAVEATTSPTAAKPPAAVESAEAQAPTSTSGTAEYLNYDALTLAQLRSRLRTLSSDELAELLAHERAGAARSPYLTMLENRIASMPAK